MAKTFAPSNPSIGQATHPISRALENDFRCNPEDTDSLNQLRILLGEVGIDLVDSLDDIAREYLQHLVWRKDTSTVESDGLPSLHMFLDLDEGDVAFMTTLRAGKVNDLLLHDENPIVKERP